MFQLSRFFTHDYRSIFNCACFALSIDTVLVVPSLAMAILFCRSLTTQNDPVVLNLCSSWKFCYGVSSCASGTLDREGLFKVMNFSIRMTGGLCSLQSNSWLSLGHDICKWISDFFKSYGYGLEKWNAFVVVRIPTSGAEVYRSLPVTVMVLVVGSLVQNCTGTSLRFDFLLYYKQKWVIACECPNSVGG